MNTTTGAALARLRSADPVSVLPAAHPDDVTARAMLDQILTEPSALPRLRHTRREWSPPPGRTAGRLQPPTR